MKITKKSRSSATNLLDMDFRYDGIDYTTSHSYNCSEEGCDNSGICRCGTIDKVIIEEINLGTICNTIYKKILDKKDILDRYCIDRLLRIHKLYDESNWEKNTSRGYYGEEVDSIKIDASVRAALGDDIEEIICSEDDEKMKIILNKEYGYLLPELKESNFSIIHVAVSEIEIGNSDHYKKLDKDIVKEYKGYNLPVCVCIMKGNKYRLVDGYHRLSAAINAKEKSVYIILAEKKE